MQNRLFFIFFILPSFSLFSLNISNSLLDAAIIEYKEGQYEFAINNFKKFIQFSDNNIQKPKAYYYLSMSYYFLSNYKMALNYLNELLTKYRVSSYSSLAYFLKGLIYQNLEEWQNALDLFERYINLYPKSELVDRAYFSSANSLLQLNRLQDAEKYLKIIIDKYKKFEKYEEASVFYAYILIKNDKKNQAKEFLSNWIEKIGEKSEKYQYKDRFWLYYAEILLEERKYEEARIFLKKIDLYANNSPSSDIALLRLSQIEALQGNEKEAKEYIIRLNNEYPLSKYNIDSTLNMGISEYIKGNYNDAINLFNIVNLAIIKKLNEKLTTFERDRLFSIHSNALFYIGESYYRLRDNKSAQENFFEVVKRNYPLKFKALIRIIEILFEEKKYKEINDIFSKYEKIFVKEDEDYLLFVLYKARYLYVINKNKESLDILNKIKEDNNNFITIMELKSKNYVKLQDIPKAIQILINSFPYIPLNKKAFYGYEIVSLYFNNSQYDKALEFYSITQSFIDESEDKNEILIKLEYVKSLCYMAKKDYQKSIDSFKNIIFNLKNEKFKDIITKSYYYLGWCYYKISNFNESTKFFNISSNSLLDANLLKDSYYMEAMSYFSNRNYNLSYQKFEVIYKKYYPEELSIMAFYYMAKSLENLNKIEEALKNYYKIYTESNLIEYKILSLFELIKYNLNNNNIEEANNLIKQLENLDKDKKIYFQVLLLQAETFISLKRYSEAYSIYNYYIKNKKDDKDLDYIYYWAAYSAEMIKDYISAKYFYEIIENSYLDSKFYYITLYSLLKIYKIENDYLKEKEIIRKILLIEKEKKKIEELYNRIREIELIEKGISEEEANLLLLVEKGDIEAKINLAKLYIKSKNKSKGIELLTNIAKERNDKFGAIANNILGDLILEENNYQEALIMYLKTVQNYKAKKDTIAEALYKSSYCYYKLNNPSLALKIIERIKKDFAEMDWSLKSIELEKRIQR